MNLTLGLNPFLVRVGVGTMNEADCWSKFAGLNPFLVRVGVGTSQKPKFAQSSSLNPFLVRVGVGTFKSKSVACSSSVLIPSWLGWVLERSPRI